MDEAGLRRAARAGDVRAFERLLASLLPDAWRVGVAMLGSADRATDAVEHAAAAAWRTLPRLAVGASLEDWFLSILVTECRMAGRDDAGARPDAGADPRLPGAPMAAFDALAPDDRALLVLHDLEGRPVEEVAAILHLRVETAVARLGLARTMVAGGPAMRGHDASAAVQALLSPRAAIPMPAGMRDRILVLAARTPQDPRPRPSLGPATGLGALALVSVMAVGGLGLLALGRDRPLAEAGSTPSAGPAATASAAPSAMPTDAAPSPSATIDDASPPGDGLQPDTMAIVTREGDRLRVRSAPGTGSDSRRLEPLLSSGTTMLVLAGPVQASGFDWYRVHVPDEQLAGWVAEGRDGISWIEGISTSCPATVDSAALQSLSPDERLVCLGGTTVEVRVDGVSPLELDGPCPFAASDRTCRLEPGWFAPSVELLLPGGANRLRFTQSALAPSVSGPLPPGPAIVRLHVDDPAAATCRVRDDAGDDVVEPWIAALDCRLRIVVEGMEPAPG